MAETIGMGIFGAIGYTSGTAAAATVVGSAVIGAVVGGIAAAVQNQDIGKGILYGAVGGAVMGGVSEWISGASWATPETQTATNNGAQWWDVELAADAAANEGAGSAFSSAGSKFGDAANAALVTTAGQGIMKLFDTSAQDAAKEKQKDRELMVQLEAMKDETAKAVAGMSGRSSSASSDAAKYAADLQLLNAREERALTEKMREREYTELKQKIADRAATVSGFKTTVNPLNSNTTTTPVVTGNTIDEQVNAQTKNLYNIYPEDPTKGLGQAGVLSYG